jgi:ferrous iron transport protein B
VFNSMGTDGSFGNQNNGKSLLATAAKNVTPILSPLGIKPDNWQATVGIITGIFAKEAVVGTLNTLYQADQNGDAKKEDAPTFNFMDTLKEAAATIPANLGAINVEDPMGLNIGDVKDQKEAAAAQEVDVSTYSNMQNHFMGGLGAFSYLLFVLLYMPCSAAMGALVRESGKNWATFVALWCNLLAFAGSTLFYQFTHIAENPQRAITWIAFYLIGFTVLIMGMKRRGDILFNKKVTI